MLRARKRGGSKRLSRRQALGGKGSGGGDKPLRMVAGCGQWISLRSAAGRSTAVRVRAGTGIEGACTQSAAGMGQGMPSQSGQWLQGVLDVPICVDPPIGNADAATDTNPLARTARQANVAARERKRITRSLSSHRARPANRARITVARGRRAPVSPLHRRCCVAAYRGTPPAHPPSGPRRRRSPATRRGPTCRPTSRARCPR